MSSAPTEGRGRPSGAVGRRPRHRTGSIRLRLTLLYGAILALALALFGGAIYAIVQNALFDTARTALLAEATGLDPGRALAQLTAPASAGGPGVGDEAALGLNLQIRSITGTVLAASPDLHGMRLPLAPSALARLQHGAAIGPDRVALGGRSALLYSYRASTHGGTDRGPAGQSEVGQGGRGSA